MEISELLSNEIDDLWHLSRQMGLRHAISRLPLDKFGNPSVNYDDLVHLKTKLYDFGFRLGVIEPDINWQWHRAKLGLEGSEKEIEEIICLIRNMGRLDIPVLCYNFMAGFNWIRTSHSIPDRGGALVSGYDSSIIRNAPFTTYGLVSEDQLWSNLEKILKIIVPIAEESGVYLALHPDDPPVSTIRGISRIITSSEAVDRALNIVPSRYHGVTLCQGSFAAAGEDINFLINKWGREHKIFYVHFRDIKGSKNNFHETFHDDGITNMAEAIFNYIKNGYDGPIRVDHVPTMWGEENKVPGYETLGRLYAIGYMKGLIEGVTLNQDYE